MKKFALLAGTCALFFFVACGDDSSTSASKNDSPSTAEITPPKDTAQVDSGCTVKESAEGFDIICNGDSVDTIHDEETEQGTCHVKDTVNASGSAGVKITCGDSTRFVWTATNDKDESSSSTKEEKVSSGKENGSSASKDENVSSGTENGSSASKDENVSSGNENTSSSSQKESSEKSSSSVKSEDSSSSVKPGNSSSSAKPESSSVKEESSSSSSEETHSSSILQAPAPDTLTCNSKKYTTDTAFCFRSRLSGNYAVYKLCGESEYDPDVATCDGGTVKVECGGTAYDTLQKVCLNEALYPLTATEEGIDGVYIGANDTTFNNDKNIVSVKPIYFAKANLLLVKKGEGNYEGVIPPSPGIISKGARIKYHNEQYYDIEADTLDLFVFGDTSGYFYLTSMNLSSSIDIAGNDAYDIARAKLGGKWRLPRYKELTALYNNYLYNGGTRETIIDHHTVCIDITAPVHKTEIALPSAGMYNDTTFDNKSVYTSQYMLSMYNYSFTATFQILSYTNYNKDRFGFSVRPVFTGD